MQNAKQLEHSVSEATDEGKKNRNHLEHSLSQAIDEHDLLQANSLIDILLNHKDTNQSRLESLDEQNRSFLFQSLEIGLKEIASRLLNLQEQNEKIIFGQDEKGRTLISIAAEQGYDDVLKKLLTLCNNAKQPYKKFWLHRDLDGNTALHMAARGGRNEVLKLLIGKIQVEENAKEILNQPNAMGKTVLHKAFYLFSIEILKMLIENGADMNVLDNKNVSPLDLLLKRDVEDQLDLIRSLKIESKMVILHSYRHFLIKHPEQNKVKEIYFTFSGLHNLKSLLLAHHEFNHEIEKTVRNSLKNSNTLIHNGIVVPDHMYALMPLYWEKVKQIAVELKIPIDKKLDQDIASILEKSIATNYQIVSQDRTLLNQLIDDIDNYLQSLATRRHIPITNRIVAISFPVFLFIIFVVVLTLLSIKAAKAEQLFRNCAKENDFMDCRSENGASIGYALLATFFALFVGVGIGIGGWKFGRYFWRKELNISSRERDDLLENIQNILESLQKAKIKEVNDKQTDDVSYLTETIRNLETELTGVTATLHRSITDIINIYTHFKNILHELRINLNKSQKPISLFFKQRNERIEINSDFENPVEEFDLSDEETPLKRGVQ